MKVKLGFSLYLSYNRKVNWLRGHTHTHLYSDRDMIQTGRESQTEDLVGKTEERAQDHGLVQLGHTLTQEGVEV